MERHESKTATLTGANERSHVLERSGFDSDAVDNVALKGRERRAAELRAHARHAHSQSLNSRLVMQTQRGTRHEKNDLFVGADDVAVRDEPSEQVRRERDVAVRAQQLWRQRRANDAKRALCHTKLSVKCVVGGGAANVTRASSSGAPSVAPSAMAREPCRRDARASRATKRLYRAARRRQ